MRRSNPTASGALLLGLAAVMAYSAPGVAQQFAPSVDLYSGGTAVTEGIKLGGWGSGKATEDRAYKTAGDTSIKIETGGYYAGARIEFEEPKDITEQKNDPYGFIEFIIKFQPGKKRPSLAGPMGYPGGDYGSAGEFGQEEGGFPGAPGAALPFPGGPGGPAIGGATEVIAPDTRKLKIVLLCEEGTFVSSNFPLALYPAREEGWFSVAVPFVAFAGLDKAQTAKVKELRIFGDTKDTFWVGEIRTTTDDEPINVDSLDEMEVSVGEPVEFTSSATGGISPLAYSWDFDLSDGIQEDAAGPTTVHVFRKASPPVPGQAGEVQPFVVTLTVRDLSGAKKPVRRQTNVIVNN